MRHLGSFRWSVVLARAPPSGNSLPRLDARPPASGHGDMPAPTTLSELIALYLARCRIEGLSPRTQCAYSETLARFQRSVAAQGLPDAAAAVETATVIRYCESFQARRPATRHRYFRAVRCFFNWCVAAGFLDHTPFRGLRNVRLPSEVVQPFRPAELARLVAACDPATAVGRRDAAVVLLFLDTGIRCAELSALDLADCDLPRGRLLIRHGKGNKQRVVPFARHCRAALEAYLAVRGRTPGPLVWAVTRPGQLRPGVRLQPNGLKQLLRRRGRAAHVPRCHAHRFRHTFATWAIQQDARELDVQHLLGHAGGVPCLIVELRLEEPQARARIAGREHDPLRTSDATEDVHAAQRERFEPVTDAEGASLVLDASRSPGALARDSAEALAGGAA